MIPAFMKCTQASSHDFLSEGVQDSKREPFVAQNEPFKT